MTHIFDQTGCCIVCGESRAQIIDRDIPGCCNFTGGFHPVSGGMRCAYCGAAEREVHAPDCLVLGGVLGGLGL